jgi:hypothetical protein
MVSCLATSDGGHNGQEATIVMVSAVLALTGRVTAALAALKCSLSLQCTVFFVPSLAEVYSTFTTPNLVTDGRGWLGAWPGRFRDPLN